jgi:hypothetical protein
MGLFDSGDTPDVPAGISNVAYAASVSSTLADQPSLLEGVGNAVSKYVPLAFGSMLNNYYNDAVAVGNFFGADLPSSNYREFLHNQGWEDLENFYTQHQQGVEAGGLIAGAFIPGLAAVKAVKVMQAGKLGITASRATNLFMTPTEDFIKGATATIKNEASLFPGLTSEKVQAIALGFRDQAVQTLAFETADMATNRTSPLLQNDGYVDALSDIAKGFVFGTVVGGGLEGFSLWSKMNKAMALADASTKENELMNLLFKNNDSALSGGSLLAGDKAATAFDGYFDTLDRIKAAPDALSLRKATVAENTTLAEIRKSLSSLAGTGNEAFSNALVDMIVTGIKSGKLSREAVADQLSKLQSIKPVGDSALESPATNYFYVNKFTSPSPNSPPSLNDLLSVVAHQGADYSRRFEQIDPTRGVKLARYDTPFTTQEGTVIPRFDTAEEAFDAGNDLFLNRNGAISVNPSPPNIREVPLEGQGRILTATELAAFQKTGMAPAGSAPIVSAPKILDLQTGNWVTSAVRTLGDYAGSDNVKVLNKGVMFGQREFSPQSFTTSFDATTDTTDAMARYLWMRDQGVARRGLQIFDGTSFATADLPALEAMYYEGAGTGNWAKYIETLEKRGVTFSSGASLPSTEQQMLNKIQIAKDDFIRDVMAYNPNLSAEEIARRANVSDQYMLNGFQTTKTTDFMRPQEEISSIQHLQSTFDIGNTQRPDGMIVKGLAASLTRIQMLQDTKDAVGAKFFGDRWQNFKMHYNSGDGTVEGPRPGFFTFSNAKAGTMANNAEFIGRNVDDFTTKMNNAIDSIMAPHYSRIRAADGDLFRELNALTQVFRSTGESYIFLPEFLQQQYMQNMAAGGRIAVLEDSVLKNKTGDIIDWNSGYKPEGFFDGATKADLATAALGPHPVGLKTFYELTPQAADFHQAVMENNNKIIRATNDLWASQGLQRQLPVDRLYAPPIDTSKYPYIAIVKPKAGSAFADGSTAVITSATEDGLKRKIGMIDPQGYDIFTKDQIKSYFDIQGEYDYTRNFNSGIANNMMKRRGILNDALPASNPEVLIKDYIDFQRRQNFRIVRDYTEALNDQPFTELKAMGSFYDTGTSKVTWWNNKMDRPPTNPYDSYIKTALNIRQEVYPQWRDNQMLVENYANNAFNTVKSAFIQAQKGITDYEKVSSVAEEMGLGNPYAKAIDSVAAYQDMAAQLPPRHLLSKFVHTMNGVMAVAAVKLDAFQSLITAAGAPILMTAELLNARKNLLLSVPQTGGAVQVPSVMKVLAGAVGDLFNSNTRNEWMPWLRENGIVRDYLNTHSRLVEAATLPVGADATEATINSKIATAINLAGKLSGAQLTEDWSRYTAAMVARRLYQGVVDDATLKDNMTTMVNRIHGNYVSAQRPEMFQGWGGAALSLFQTYQINLFQQLFRYVQDKDYKALAMFSALQGGIFGVNGMPGTQLVNQYLIGNASSNPAHKDMYSTTMSAFDKEVGDWILYGSLSNVLGVGIYNRGDVNPRGLSIVNLNPLEVPAISGPIKFLSNLFETSQKLVNGGAFWNTITTGLEHNGISRPLAGFGQLAQGFTTSADGKLQSRIPSITDDGTQGWSDLQIAANFGRLMGARPLDETILLDALYRSNAYDAKDKARMGELGGALRTKMVGNQPLTGDDVTGFASRYAASGGQMQHFGNFIVDTAKNANAAQANQVFLHLAKPLAQQMMLSMGGVKLPDYMFNPPTATATTGAPQ